MFFFLRVKFAEMLFFSMNAVAGSVRTINIVDLLSVRSTVGDWKFGGKNRAGKHKGMCIF